MGKSIDPAAQAEELRAATREANGTLKDANRTLSELRALMSDLPRLIRSGAEKEVKAELIDVTREAFEELQRLVVENRAALASDFASMARKVLSKRTGEPRKIMQAYTNMYPTEVIFVRKPKTGEGE